MRVIRWTRWALWLSCVAGLGLAFQAYSTSPARVPVHYGAGGIPDRWGSPLIVHPEAWRQLELRAAGPDKVPYTADDLILTPKGTQAPAE